MSTGAAQLRFPLPLKRYESFMLQDETADYPMTYVIELQLSGTLDRGAFETAYRQALELHPLLLAYVERSRWRTSRWVSAEAPAVRWLAGDDPPTRPGPIDICREPGVRVLVLKQARGARVFLQFHHVATDGIGAIQFIGDVLSRYGMLTVRPGERPPEPAPVDVCRLRDREQLWPDRQFRRRLLRTTARRCWDLSKSLPRPVTGNRIGSDPPESSPRFPSFHTQLVDGEDFSRLRRTARGPFTLNDLATLAMFRALREWNVRQDSRHIPGWLRLSLPFSLRLPLHDNAPASNQLSLMMLNRHESELGDAAATLRYVHRATEVCSQGCEGRMFTFWVGNLAQRLPWLFRLGGGKGCYCSAILANIGDVRRHLRGWFPLDEGRIVAGSVRLEALLGAACVRRGARVAASLGTYAGRLFINLNADPRWLDESAGAELLRLLTAHLLALAGAGPNAEMDQPAIQSFEASS